MIEESFSDILNDVYELDYLIHSTFLNLEKFSKDIKRASRYIGNGSLDIVNRFLAEINKSIGVLRADSGQLKKRIQNQKHSRELLEALTENKIILFDKLRTVQNLIGPLITSTDWQSPSFLHSLRSMAGSQTGKITGMINDYKRDVHLDEKSFENDFIKEYIDTKFKFLTGAYLTSSGQGAFTTILNYLSGLNTADRVLIGKSVYFQNKQLIRGCFSGRISETDESDTDQVISIIQNEKPGIIYLDSLCNTANIPVPDLKKIILSAASLRKEIYFIVDNTGLSVSFQPMSLLSGKLKIIQFESLLKYAQFGLDRVNAGIIVAYGSDRGKILEYRKHSGTNISDSAVYALPRPNRKILERRLIRLNRNATVLSACIAEQISLKRNGPFGSVSYPGLSDHNSFEYFHSSYFHGGFFSINFKKKFRSKKIYERFIKLIISEAKKRKLNIVAGTSFGFNTTRVYLTALYTEFTEPFIRVSAGTETLEEIDGLKEVFSSVINGF